MNEELKNMLQISNYYFWVRNDDISDNSFMLHKIVELYKKYTLNVIFAVIPSIVEESAINLLLNDDFFQIAQHGYDHKNYLKNLNKTYQSELCKERNPKELVEKILKGKQKLIDMTKNDINILVPPYNHIDNEISSILTNYYSTISVFGDYTSNFKNTINPNIDLINWKKRCFDVDYFESHLINLMKTTNNIGLCIHHNFLTLEDIKYLEELFLTICQCNNNNVKRRIL